jgi:hypothetical protein
MKFATLKAVPLAIALAASTFAPAALAQQGAPIGALGRWTLDLSASRFNEALTGAARASTRAGLGPPGGMTRCRAIGGGGPFGQDLFQPAVGQAADDEIRQHRHPDAGDQATARGRRRCWPGSPNAAAPKPPRPPASGSARSRARPGGRRSGRDARRGPPDGSAGRASSNNLARPPHALHRPQATGDQRAVRQGGHRRARSKPMPTRSIVASDRCRSTETSG